MMPNFLPYYRICSPLWWPRRPSRPDTLSELARLGLWERITRSLAVCVALCKQEIALHWPVLRDFFVFVFLFIPSVIFALFISLSSPLDVR